MKQTYLLALSFVLTLMVQPIHSQVNSPYSRYGFGTMTDRAMGFNKGMGGVALGFHNGKQINTSNPASYAYVDSLSALFDLGFSIQHANHKMGNLQQNAQNASFDYFAFQFRGAKNLGVTLAVLPLTHINYSFSSSKEVLKENENYSSNYAFSGEGGVHKAVLGLGWRPFKPLAIGVNGAFIWGDYTHNMNMQFNESSVYNLQRKYNANINTYSVDFGLQYDMKFTKKDALTLGLTYGLGHKINNKAYRQTNTLNSSTTIAQTVDTIRDAFELPHSFGVGLTYSHSDKLRIGADFIMEQWGKAKFPSQDMNTSSGSTTPYQSSTNQLNDMWKLAAGLDYCPNRESSKFFSHNIYRVGAFYSHSYAKADITNTISDKPYELGVSAGIGIPITNKNIWHNSPCLNISAQWVHTVVPYLSASTMQKATLRENYFRLSIGLTFNERWFYKWKVQ